MESSDPISTVPLAGIMGHMAKKIDPDIPGLAPEKRGHSHSARLHSRAPSAGNSSDQAF